MLIATADIAAKQTEATELIAKLAYNRFARKLYGLQTPDLGTERKLLLLLYALSHWDNRTGALNAITADQLRRIMDNVTLCASDPLALKTLSVQTNCAPTASSGVSRTVIVASSMAGAAQNDVFTNANLV